MAFNTLGEHSEILEDGPHSLLEPVQRAFSNLTVRRAFVVWLNRGQDSKFKDICNYFHTLEETEELDMTPEERARSRRLELNLFSSQNQVEQSDFLQENFPYLYGAPIPASLVERAEAIKNETCVFKLNGFESICQEGLKTADLLSISKLVRDYCKQTNITLRKFLKMFTDHSNKCQLLMTGLNVEFYVKNKLIEGEIELLNQFPLGFSFLDGPDYGDVDIITKIKHSTANRNLYKGQKTNDLNATKAELAEVVGKVLNESVKKAFYSAPNIVISPRSCPTPTSSDSGKNSGEAPMEEEHDGKSSDEGVGEDEGDSESSTGYTTLIPY